MAEMDSFVGGADDGHVTSITNRKGIANGHGKILPVVDEHGKLQARIIDLRAQKDALFEEVRPRKTVSRPK